MLVEYTYNWEYIHDKQDGKYVVNMHRPGNNYIKLMVNFMISFLLESLQNYTTVYSLYI